MNLRGDWLARFHTLGRLTHQGIIPWGDWLTRVLYPREIDSPWYYTPGDRKIWITRSNLYQIRIYYNPLVRGPGRLKLCLKKTGGQKSHWTVLLRNRQRGYLGYSLILYNFIKYKPSDVLNKLWPVDNSQARQTALIRLTLRPENDLGLLSWIMDKS